MKKKALHWRKQETKRQKVLSEFYFHKFSFGKLHQRRVSVSDAESELHEARGGALDSLVDMDQDGDDAQEGAN